MVFMEEGNIGEPTIIEMDHEEDIKKNIENYMAIVVEHIAEALAKGNEVVIRCHNDKIFIYELKYME